MTIWGILRAQDALAVASTTHALHALTQLSSRRQVTGVIRLAPWRCEWLEEHGCDLLWPHQLSLAATSLEQAPSENRLHASPTRL